MSTQATLIWLWDCARALAESNSQAEQDEFEFRRIAALGTDEEEEAA